MTESALTRQLVAEGCDKPLDIPTIWETASDVQFAEFVDGLVSRDVTVAAALREAARRLRERSA